MTREEMYEKLNLVFRDVFDDDEIVVNDQTTSDDIEDWDSLMQITLLAQLEETFNIHFAMKNILNLKNVGQLADQIMELIG